MIPCDIAHFTGDELAKAVSKIKQINEESMDMRSQCFLNGEFPKILKTARLVLLEKYRKQEQEKLSYRPLCLLYGIRKILQHLLMSRLPDDLDNNRDLIALSLVF